MLGLILIIFLPQVTEVVRTCALISFHYINSCNALGEESPVCSFLVRSLTSSNEWYTGTSAARYHLLLSCIVIQRNEAIRNIQVNVFSVYESIVLLFRNHTGKNNNLSQHWFACIYLYIYVFIFSFWCCFFQYPQNDSHRSHHVYFNRNFPTINRGDSKTYFNTSNLLLPLPL